MILQPSYLHNGISYTGTGVRYHLYIESGLITLLGVVDLQGVFKKHELLNLRALKFSPVNKIHIFQSMDKIFCMEFQRVPLKFHTKYLTHTLKDMSFIEY